MSCHSRVYEGVPAMVCVLRVESTRYQVELLRPSMPSLLLLVEEGTGDSRSSLPSK